MVSPTQPWPRASKFDDALSEIIAGGDIAQARDYFDKVFWENQADRPGWKHLRLALLKEDRPMLRLLATWGAHPSQDEMAHFRAVTGEKYDGYVRLLKQAGLRADGQPWEEIVPQSHVKDTEDDLIVKSMLDNSFTDHRFDKIPKEWLTVLDAFQQAGSNEAVIAGGALRDLFNQRQIKDVDIFLRTQGSEKKNRKYLEAVFNASAVPVHAQSISYSDGYSRITKQENFPTPRKENDSAFDDSLKRERRLESWTVIAGAKKTEYNVIFVDDTLDQKLLKDSNKFEGKSIFAGGLLDAFDVGLTQIATDGKTIVSTAAYKDDVRNKRITLTRPNQASEDHVKRIVAKYPDFEQTQGVKDLLKPKPAPQRRSYGYDW